MLVLDRRELRLPAIDLIGASELLSSWPRTRIRRCHAFRSSSRSARLTSERTTKVCGTPCWRNELLRSSQRTRDSPTLSSTTVSLFAVRHSCRPRSAAFRPRRCFWVFRKDTPPRRIYEPQPFFGKKEKKGTIIFPTPARKKGIRLYV